ncbi:MAG: GNAT family N-acetyltransferase [Rhodobacteraceae bacterium]|nr:GNAT family N-acetyltransferase [Paracoccaceae bacterium]
MQDLTKDDIPDMVPLFRALHRHHVVALPEVFHDDGTDAQFADHLAHLFDDSGAAVGVRRHGRLIGYALFLLQERPADAFRHPVKRAYLDHLIVTEPNRGAAHATAMIAAMETRLVSQGINVWTASHYAFNAEVARTFADAGAHPDLVRVAKLMLGAR